MNCTKCGVPTNHHGHLCESCYTQRASHLHSIISPQARQQPGRLLALGIAAFLLSLLFAAIAYDYAHATALDNASIHVQAMRAGLPLASTDYQLLSDNGLIFGRTDADGMVLATGIDSGAWTLEVGCARTIVYAAEVQGQVIQQVDAACVMWLPGVKN